MSVGQCVEGVSLCSVWLRSVVVWCAVCLEHGSGVRLKKLLVLTSYIEFRFHNV
jgi:hypothetical protein